MLAVPFSMQTEDSKASAIDLYLRWKIIRRMGCWLMVKRYWLIFLGNGYLIVPFVVEILENFVEKPGTRQVKGFRVEKCEKIVEQFEIVVGRVLEEDLIDMIIIG